jgi:hypothetical protein
MMQAKRSITPPLKPIASIWCGRRRGIKGRGDARSRPPALITKVYRAISAGRKSASLSASRSCRSKVRI